LLLAAAFAVAGTGAYAGLGGFSNAGASSSAGGGSSSGGASNQSPTVKGNSGSAVPAAPAITSAPPNPTWPTSPTATATFSYTDSTPGVTFQCSLSSTPASAPAYSACGGPSSPSSGSRTYSGLLPGSYTFSVEAAHGSQVGPATTYSWQINGESFTINWTAPTAFYPGTSQSADLTITNPNAKAITIAAGGITLQSVTAGGGCSPSYFLMTQGLTHQVTINAYTTTDLLAALKAAGGTASNLPVIKMTDANTNQDNCEGVSLAFHFTATATGS
jgi:hypothetical protein